MGAIAFTFAAGHTIINNMKKLTARGNNTFTHGVNFHKIFWVFFTRSLIGFIYENTLGLLQNGYFELRQGLMYGPFIPVYGIGAVVLVLFLRKIRHSFVLFLIGSVLGGVVEYIASYVQQYVFGSVSWNYSHEPLNIGGRTDVIFALFWGLLGVLMIRIIYPKLSMLIDKIPNRPGFFITWILIIFIVFDIFISSAAVMRMYQRYEHKPAVNVFERFLDEWYPDKKVRRVYGNMVFKGRDTSFSIDGVSGAAPGTSGGKDGEKK